MEERCEGLLRNYQAQRRELSILEEVSFTQNRRSVKNDLEIVDAFEPNMSDLKTNKDEHSISSFKAHVIKMVNTMNLQISDFISGKSKDFETIHKHITSLKFS